MAEEADNAQPVDYLRLFPWLHLTRAFRMAVDPRKLLLAGLALFAIAAADATYNAIRFPREAEEAPPPSPSSITAYGEAIEDLGRSVGMSPSAAPPLGDALDAQASGDGRTHLIEAKWPWDRVDPTRRGDSLMGRPRDGATLVLSPLATLAEPLRLLLPSSGVSDAGYALGETPEPTWVDRVYLLLRLVFTLLVWGVVAGAITRMSALEFARDERLGTMTSIRYAIGRLTSFTMAPVIALVCIAILAVLCLLGGLIGRLPFFGPLFAGVLWFLPLIAGFVMALVAVGAAVGWPLMYATISTQDSDAFDGFSRSYTFVYGRPWYLAWLAVVTILLGSIGVLVVQVFVDQTDQFATRAVGLGMSQARVEALVGTAAEGTSGTWAAVFWRRLLLLLAAGFGASFFWVSATISYFLLRRADDGTALEEVEVEVEEQDHLAPLAGVVASSQPTTERNVVELSTSGPSSGNGSAAEEHGDAIKDSGADAPKTETEE